MLPTDGFDCVMVGCNERKRSGKKNRTLEIKDWIKYVLR